jgi:hypothetical protein
MFYDWVSIYQDFDYELPVISPTGYAFFDFIEGSMSPIRQSKLKHEGSYSTSLSIHVQGNRILIEGNPSRYGRLDNLFGFNDLDDCIKVYNNILKQLNLPVFSKCTFIGYEQKQTESGAIKLKLKINGAVFTRLDITSNQAVGSGHCVGAYLKAVSMQSYRRSIGHIYADGNTVDFKSKLGNSRYIYPCIYNKAYEFKLHLLPKLKKLFSDDSKEIIYINNLIDYCENQGVTRHEQKLKSEFLAKENLNLWGLLDQSKLIELHQEFLNIDQKLKVSAMDLKTITETLINEGICKNTQAANITSLYAINWLNGQKFNSNLSSVKTHRARLRKIGIDILKPCNLLLFSPVIVKEVIEINRTELKPPSFYIHPKTPLHLTLVA